jgi:predicted dehydrogenase
MGEQIRIGLVGTGDIGRLHAKSLKKLRDVELVVCRGVKPKGAERFAQDFGARVYSSYAEMLSDRSILGVDICVPNDLHRRYVEQAAAAGKQILCEKPIAMSLEDAEAMIDAANHAGVLLMIAHPLRFWPEYVKMREIIQLGKLGNCVAITLRRMLSLLVSVPGERGWRRSPERMGGAILDLQIHDLDFLSWTFGRPQQVYCAAARSTDGGLNHTYVTLRYSSGMVAMAESSYMLQGDPMVFTVKAICERGTLDYGLHLEQFAMHVLEHSAACSTRGTRPETLVCYRPSQEPEILAWQDPDVLGAVFKAQLSYFVDCAQGKIPNSVAPVQEALEALKLALAARVSALSGQVVDMK